jgi:hypothetical protein
MAVQMDRSGLPVLAVLVAVGAVAACSRGGALGPGAPQGMSFSVAATTSGSSGPTTTQSSDSGMTQSDSTDTLTLSKVQLVVRRVELAPVDTGAQGDTLCSQGDDDGEHPAQWTNVGHCDEVKVGPFLVDVPLDGQVEKVFSAQLPVGTYGGVELQIHAPSHYDPSDSAFLQANPDFDSVSVRAEGTFDGKPFTFTSRIEARQRNVLNPPVQVTADSIPTNITFHLDLSRWFVRPDGTLIDPSTATGYSQTGEMVRWNIMSSLQTFRDNDRNGQCDGGGRNGGFGGGG